MTPENFCYWLQGMLELGSPTTLDAAQTAMIKRHLETVFLNVTASQPVSSAPSIRSPSWLGGDGVRLC